jgi:hypothetical protein
MGSARCADCRVALVADRPEHLARPTMTSTTRRATAELSELGEWPKLQAQVLRRRLESAGVPVMIEWTGAVDDRRASCSSGRRTPAAGLSQAQLARRMKTSQSYIARIEEHMSAVVGLLEELRTKLDELEAEGRLS